MRRRLFLALWLPILITAVAAQESNSTRVEFDRMVMGKWWKNSETVKRMQLSESQIARIEQIYLGHQKSLAAVLKRLQEGERRLKAFMSAERIPDAQARREIDQVAASRGELEKITASMNLSIRKVLSIDQWKILEQQQEGRIRASGGGTAPPRIISQRQPSYTAEAKANRIEGVVVMQMVVRRDGKPDSFKVLKGLGYGLDLSVMDTVSRHWKFEPGMKDGKAVDTRTTIEVSFRLY